MVIGVILRNFKIYRNINYIPLSNGEKYCGLIGNNGIGKSSVLEALDCYFNNRDWDLNIDSNKSGIDSSYILPIFLIEKTKITRNNEIAERLSNAIWNIELDTIVHTTHKENVEKFKGFISKFDKKFSSTDYYLLPLGDNIDREFTLSVFKINSVLKKIIEQEDFEEDENYYNKIKDSLIPLKDEIKELVDYIYIPKDIEPNKLIQLETSEIQILLGENLETIISQSISKTQIQNISSSLKVFIDDLSSKLDGYKFKAHSSYQPNLKPNKIYSLIVEEFFRLRELHKEGIDEGRDLLLKQLSSGEKQQAILSVFHSIITTYRKNSSNLILAVDEPESSLHISACFDQFEKLYKMSNSCCQIFFSSHWYGFIPAMSTGVIINIMKQDSTHQFIMFDIAKYREEIKISNKEHAKKHNCELPLDISLKSNNDFIQSIISSIIKEKSPYNWLICEGSSEKIYFEAYFKNEIENKKLRIIPVGGAGEIKKVYAHLKILFDELKTKIKGKVFLLSDTDAELVEYDTTDYPNMKCNRIVNDLENKITKLVKIQSNPKSPKTEIEDALNGKIFYKTLLSFKDKYPDLAFIEENKEVEEIPSYIALDLKTSECALLDNFFNVDDNKCKFATKYVEELNNDKYENPSWILDIKSFFGF